MSKYQELGQAFTNSAKNYEKQIRRMFITKKLKWILYKQYHTFSDTQLDDLDAAFAQCKDLQKYYHAREDFHHILDNSTSTETGIDNWTKNLALKGITLFDSCIKTLSKTKEYVANYVIDYLSNAVTEGLNNLIRSIRPTLQPLG